MTARIPVDRASVVEDLEELQSWASAACLVDPGACMSTVVDRVTGRIRARCELDDEQEEVTVAVGHTHGRRR